MTRKAKEELSPEELEEQNGETLPEREVMSIISTDPQPIEGAVPDSDGPPFTSPPEDRVDPQT